MNRAETLEAAKKIVCEGRDQEYGGPEDTRWYRAGIVKGADGSRKPNERNSD